MDELSKVWNGGLLILLNGREEVEEIWNEEIKKIRK